MANFALQQEYKSLAKKADQRLVRLMAYRHEKGFQSITQYAFKRAQTDIKSWGLGKKKKFGDYRFNINTKKLSDEQVEMMIRDIKRFLNSETSTKSGIMKVYKRKADSINKKYGTKFDWESLAKFHEKGLASKMDKILGSKTALKVIASIQKKGKNAIDSILNSDESVLTSAPESVDNEIKKLIGENKKLFDDLI